jgi:hypothetical protein
MSEPEKVPSALAKANKSDMTRAATSDGATMWGLPDWRDPASYGDFGRWRFNRWRWEFYRRREDLRDFFDANSALMYEWEGEWLSSRPEGAVMRTLRPDEPGFTVMCSVDDMVRLGYHSIPNPRISEQPSSVLSPYNVPQDFKYFWGQGPRRQRGSQKIRALGDGEIAVVFDIDQPLREQIRGVEHLLQDQQSEKHGKRLQPQRRHPAKWLGYLRTLDARENGVSWTEVASFHQYTTKSAQTARDIWKQARALCFNF